MTILDNVFFIYFLLSFPIEYIYEEEGRRFLENVKGYFAVIVVAGKYRSGKSYMLN
jgi:hypothetical protein